MLWQSICSENSSSFLVLVTLLLLRSEIPSGVCAKLRTVAESNNRDHARNLSYYCLLALHI